MGVRRDKINENCEELALVNRHLLRHKVCRKPIRSRTPFLEDDTPFEREGHVSSEHGVKNLVEKNDQNTKC